MGLVVVAEGESGTEILGEKRLLGILNVLQNGSINGLLSLESLLGDLLLLAGIGKELVLTSLLGLGVLLEEGINNLRSINSLDVNLSAGGQSVSLVHSLKGNTVDLVGAGNEEETRGELLEENNTSATEATSEEDEDAAWNNALSELSNLVLGALLVVLLLVVSGVPCELLDHFIDL